MELRKISILVGILTLASLPPVNGQTRPSDAVLYPIVQNSKIGFIDNKGNVIVPPQFMDVRGFSEGLAAVSRLIGSVAGWGYIDTTGNIVIQPTLDIQYPQKFSEGLAAFMMNNGTKYGYIDRAGHVVIQPKFDRGFDF